MIPDNATDIIEGMYRAFNQRDAEGASAHLAPSVDWPNAETGARLSGPSAVRAYWTAQWKKSDPRVEPVRIETGDDGKLHVRVDQLVRDLSGKVLVNQQVEHVYTFDGAFITRMEIVEVAQEEDDEDEDA